MVSLVLLNIYNHGSIQVDEVIDISYIYLLQSIGEKEKLIVYQN